NIFEVTYNMLIDRIQRIYNPHIDMLVFMDLYDWTVWEKIDYIALFDIRVSVLNIWIRVVQQDMSFRPDIIIATKKFQNIHKPFVILLGLKNRPMSCIMKSIDKQNNGIKAQ